MTAPLLVDGVVSGISDIGVLQGGDWSGIGI